MISDNSSCPKNRMIQNSNLFSKCQFSTPLETGVGRGGDGVAVWNLPFFLFYLVLARLRLQCSLWMISAKTPLVKRFFALLAQSLSSVRLSKNHILTSNFKHMRLACTNEIWKIKAYSLPPLWPPQRRKIPPELTNRYVKNEAFIVVVFNGILTLLSTTTMAIFSEIVVVVVSNLILTRLAPLSICTLLPIVSVATHLPTAF